MREIFVITCRRTR